jgi:hypothetical protein
MTRSRTNADNALASATIITARKTANQSVTSSTTVANDTHLTFAVAANEVWMFSLYLGLSFLSGANLKATMNGPSGATILWSFTPNLMLDTGFAPIGPPGKGLGVTDITYADATATTVGISGVIVNGSTAGSCTLQWAQGTSSGSASTIKINSYLVAIKGV